MHPTLDKKMLLTDWLKQIKIGFEDQVHCETQDKSSYPTEKMQWLTACSTGQIFQRMESSK